MRKSGLFFCLILLFAVGLATIFLLNKTPRFDNIVPDKLPIMRIGDLAISVEIADDETERRKGLSGKAALDENHGMLFIFEKPDKYAFWMSDMRFPIDIIWIADGKIVGIEENISNEFNPQNPKFYFSPEPTKYVLEVNAGFVKNRNIHIGDAVILPKSD